MVVRVPLQGLCHMLEDAVEGIASYYRMTPERFQPIMFYESVPNQTVYEEQGY
ncbi:hypothetical protein [Anaeromassilibacillus sp. SJQ-1]|uniref:hypothetical protein n=1 Tax=Anaeromassilibacillus sp. SJQ-1 TaxID=3375419 RepID=UPI003989D620